MAFCTLSETKIRNLHPKRDDEHPHPIHMRSPPRGPVSHLYTEALPWGINELLSTYFWIYWGINFRVFNKHIGVLICLCLFHTGALLCMCLTNGGNSVLSWSGSRTNITHFEIGVKNNQSPGISNQTIWWKFTIKLKNSVHECTLEVFSRTIVNGMK